MDTSANKKIPATPPLATSTAGPSAAPSTGPSADLTADDKGSPGIQFKEWEWLAMTVCRLWMDAASDPEIKRLIEMHMNGYDAAKATGVVCSVNLAREEELHAEISTGEKGYQYIADNIETWTSQFRAGPSGRSYRVPSFTTESEASQRQQSVVFTHGGSAAGEHATEVSFQAESLTPSHNNMNFAITPGYILSFFLILSTFRTDDFQPQIC